MAVDTAAWEQTQVSEFQVRKVIREALEALDDPNPHSAVADVIARIPDDEVWVVLEKLLQPMIAQIAREMRAETRVKSRPTTSARWDRVREEHDSGKIDVLQWRVSWGRGTKVNWKFLGDMTSGEVGEAADTHLVHEEANRDMKERYLRLQSTMQEESATHVEDLGEQRVKALMTQ